MYSHYIVVSYFIPLINDIFNQQKNLRSDSLTKYALTAYTECLVCNNFDTKKFYNVRRHAKDT